ncbi:hypothetical protein SAMN03097708_02451 [Thiohalomonas denitrificans]|uniref:Oxalate:formate antiporter n=1 Tax=Thiohalomonas denitrificans TaxID=415747 RepID=A0A1G5QPN1_9GAMM|nr:oxalate:formate antiporter [Thiohalomonas denitrificans]SCZ63271.1 hypothetical protein SAMN03097708_02451 [Thiohalomonas denitrificans]
MKARSERYDRSKLKMFFYWFLVGIPLSWGVWNVVTQSLILFGLSD